MYAINHNDSVLPLPSTIEQLQSANVYFQRCHNQPYCYFTERSFYRRLEDEALPSYLIFAVMATSARFLPTSESTPTNEELASRYARCSWSLIARQSTSANEYLQLHLVQAINLLAVIDFTSECACSRHWVMCKILVLIRGDSRWRCASRLAENRSGHPLCTRTSYDV